MKDLIQPTSTDFPLDVSPLSRRKESEPTLVDRFELYAGGQEIANAFSELNDPDDQRGRRRLKSLPVILAMMKLTLWTRTSFALSNMRCR